MFFDRSINPVLESRIEVFCGVRVSIDMAAIDVSSDFCVLISDRAFLRRLSANGRFFFVIMTVA